MIRLSKLRPLSGKSFTSRSPTTPATDDVVVFTIGVSLETIDLLNEFAHFKLHVNGGLLVPLPNRFPFGVRI